MRKIPFPLNEKELETFLIAALAEDVGTGDITSETVIPETAQLCATMSPVNRWFYPAFPLPARFSGHAIPM